MKLFYALILLCAVFTGALGQAHTQKKRDHISVLSVKSEVFYFKIDSDFMGGTVEVQDSTGTVILVAELNSKRNLIDFFYLENGIYIIHFEHNGVMEDYQVQLDKKSRKHESTHFSFFKLHS